jgi:hypothetical protein
VTSAEMAPRRVDRRQYQCLRLLSIPFDADVRPVKYRMQGLFASTQAIREHLGTPFRFAPHAPSYALRRVLAIGGLRSCNNQSSAIDNRSAQSIVGYRMDPASGNPSVIGFANQSVNLPRSFIIARVFARERSPDVPAVPRR